MTMSALKNALSILALVCTGTATAHHSYQMFDRNQRITYSGTVTHVEWTNPHIWFFVAVEDPRTRATVEWGFEAASGTAGATRLGWRKNHFPAGMELTVLANPLRNGEPGAGVIKITLPDGAVFGEGGKGPGVVP